MNKKTLEALKGSIKKHEDIVEGHGINKGVYNCPLCLLFYDKDCKGSCKGCPVMKKTGEPQCAGTPYDDAWNYDTPLLVNYEGRKLEDARAAYQAEVDFLRSLLPVPKGGRSGRAPKAAGQ